jgi:hypothetical protein
MSVEPVPPHQPMPLAAPRLPWGIRIADAVVLALLGLAVWIAVVGGARYLLFDIVIPLNSPLMIVYAALSVALVRHLVWPAPSARQRLRAAGAWVAARPDFATALRAAAGTRAAVFVVAFFAVVTIGYPPKVGFTISPDPFANLPARFDAGWYGDLAMHGYAWDRTFQRQRNIAFFPAMPMIMRQVAIPFGLRDGTLSRERRMLRALWAGVAVSLGAFFWGLHYLIRFGREVIGPERAPNAALLLAAYPFAIFFNAPYTEALFLLAAVGASYHFIRGEWRASSCWGLLAGLTRPNGCFLSVPLGILALQYAYGLYFGGANGGPGATLAATPLTPAEKLRASSLRFLVAAMPGLGMLAFTVYLYGITDVWFAWARSHEAWGRSYQGLTQFTTAYGWLRDEPFLEVVAGVPFNSLNTIGVLFGLALTYPVFRRLGVAWGVFVLVTLVPPLFAGGVLSMGRVTSTLFPLFLALAAIVPPRAVPSWVAGFAIGQGFCAALFFTWRELF